MSSHRIFFKFHMYTLEKIIPLFCFKHFVVTKRDMLSSKQVIISDWNLILSILVLI